MRLCPFLRWVLWPSCLGALPVEIGFVYGLHSSIISRDDQGILIQNIPTPLVVLGLGQPLHKPRKSLHVQHCKGCMMICPTP